MGKYEKLGSFLNSHELSEIPMTFAEVEHVIGQPLPRSARYPAWWSNNPSNNVMTKIWLAAGFKTEQVNVEKKELVFRRVQPSKDLYPNPAGLAETSRAYSGKAPASKSGFPPFYGSMKGLITIMPGVDLTEPADPEWGKMLEKKYGKKR